MSTVGLIFRYITFATIASLFNLLIQRLVLSFNSSIWFFALAVGLGTLTGLLLKYLLDKRWIFFDRTECIQVEVRKFGLYTAVGFGTTLIFWSSETFFWLTWGTETMRELGAIIGLSIGYLMKYQIDKRYVFLNANREAVS